MLRKIFLITLVLLILLDGGSNQTAFSMGNGGQLPAGVSENNANEPVPEEMPEVQMNRQINTDAGIQGDESPKIDEIEITISFAGDCTIGTDVSFPRINSFPYRLEKQNNDNSYFFKGVKSIFGADDLTLVNLETTLTASNKMARKKFRFKGDPAYVSILKEGSIEMVNISNNHIYDYLHKGYEDTLATLSNAGIQYSGEGNTAYYTAKGIRIASIGYTGWSTSIKNRLLGDIKNVRQNADIVVVSFHWGAERSYYPNDIQIELGRSSIDAGADIVVGHHPHVIQGIEYYKGRYIVYSLGNFCFGGNRNPSDKDTFIFQGGFQFKDKKLETNWGGVIPCRISSVKNINDYQPTILEGKEKDKVLKRIFEYGKNLKYGIKDGNNLFKYP